MFQAPPPENSQLNSQYAGFVSWHALGSAEKQPQSFSLRSDGVSRPYPEMSTGLVWDIEAIETGWQIWPDGGQKTQIPNPAIHQPLPSPGEGYTKYVKIPMAQDPNTVVLWDQASAGAWKGFCQVSAIIAQQAQQYPGLLPVIMFTDATLTSSGLNSTHVPNFQIAQPAPQPQAAPQMPPAPTGAWN